MNVMRATEKVYYLDQHLKSCCATIVNIKDGMIELDRTVAFPEGGGQEADTGIICTPNADIRFVWVKKLYGTVLDIPDFSGVKSGGIILHQVHEEDAHCLFGLLPGEPVTVRIDHQRREKLTLAHSASHFLYAAILQLFPELAKWTIGCHIKEQGARFDFINDEPISEEDVKRIEDVSNALIAEGGEIENYSYPDIYDARYWKYKSVVIPCGGTHLHSSRNIGALNVKRRKLGKNKVRISCVFSNCIYDFGKYRDEEHAASGI